MYARALRAPVLSGSLTHKTGRCAPPAPLIGLILPEKLMIYRENSGNLAKNRRDPLKILHGIDVGPKIESRACLTAGKHTTVWATLHPIWATLLPKSYVAPSEISSTLLSSAALFWAADSMSFTVIATINWRQTRWQSNLDKYVINMSHFGDFIYFI